MRRVLLNRGADANAKLATGLTFMYASGEGHVGIMRELLAHGATVNDALKPGSRLEATRAAFAALQACRIGAHLTENGADPSIVANDGSTVGRRQALRYWREHKGARN